MKVDLIEGSYFCFGCGETGDALKFVIKMNPKLNDLQACKKYFEILKSKKCHKIDLSGRKPRERKDDVEQLNIAMDYYYGLRTVNWMKDDEEEIISAREYMKQRGFKASALTHTGAKVTYNRSYGIIFPMLDNGKFKGWVCRTMIKAIEKKRKYLYNEGFSRATTLVGEYKGPEVVYIVEGYMDRLKLKQFGCKRVVAILGWKITSEQIQKLKDEGVTHVISALDNDKCGKQGTKYLSNFFKVTRFKYLRRIKDPGEMDKELFDKMNKKTLENMN